MFISKITLNPERPATRKLIAQPRSIHGMVQKAFAEESGRLLWSLDLSRRDPVIYLLSPEKPSTEHIVERYGRANDQLGIITKDYSPLLAALEEGKRFHLKTQLNPTVTVAKKRVPVVGQANLIDWFTARSEPNGFRVSSPVKVGSERVMSISKPESNNPLTLAVAEFEAIIEVADVAKFKEALINGVGRGKAYGLGFLMVSKA